MIVGKGLIASLFFENDREDVIFFASGVSNSMETRKEEYQNTQIKYSSIFLLVVFMIRPKLEVIMSYIN